MTTHLDRALQAAESARRMQADGDYNGACNRCYYAVFNAVMGLLELAGDDNPGKTHASLSRKFSEYFVLSGKAPPDLGRALAISQNLRSKADYVIAGASEKDAADAVAAMDKILAFARPLLDADAQEASDG